MPTETVDSAVVRSTGQLARLHLRDEEVGELAGRLSAILDAFRVVQAVKLEPGVRELQPPRGREDLREDVLRNPSSQDEALKNAPQAHEGFFRIPAVL